MRLLKPAAVIACVLLPAAPVLAQVDLTGTWARVGQSDNGASREPVDLLGMPMSADGRAKALSYDIAALRPPSASVRCTRRTTRSLGHSPCKSR